VRTRSGGADGFVTVQHLLAVGLSLLLLAQIANLLVVAYGRGAVRAALDEAVRAASVAGAPAGACEERAAAVLADLLGGTMGAGVEPVRCWADAEVVRASADAAFAAWLPGVPPHRFTTTALMVREQLP
jgi:hypothetical protein